MPESVKWELVSFGLKVLPVVMALVLAWVASRRPTAKKALMELQDSIKQAAAVVNQVYVEPRKAGGPWGEEEKARARELFWQKFLEIASVKADKWLGFLVGAYGEEWVREKVVGNELEGALQGMGAGVGVRRGMGAEMGLGQGR